VRQRRATKTRERAIDITFPVLRNSPRPGSISSEPMGRDGNENFTSEFFRIRSSLRLPKRGAAESGIPDNSNTTLCHPALISDDGTLSSSTLALSIKVVIQPSSGRACFFHSIVAHHVILRERIALCKC
jgi:hypothetical protein